LNNPLVITYSDTYQDWLLGAGDGSHAANPVRAKLATELLAERLGKGVKVANPTPRGTATSDRAKLDYTHNPAYVARTLGGESSEWYYKSKKTAAAGFAMFRGTIRAVELILAGKANVVFNPQGAKHHARFAQGSGFCVFNDMAYAALAFKAAGLKPLYIDWDIHAGDGVYQMLKGTEIPTISIHHQGIYPGDAGIQSLDGTRREVVDGENHAFGLNVLGGDGDDVFMAAIDRAAEIIDEYQPDVILLAAGADGHVGVGNLGAIANYTKAGFKYAAEMVARKATEYANGRVLIGGAGGYQPLKETPETWALVVETIYNNTQKGA
jgi:acetoin utilization protein AcuC